MRAAVLLIITSTVMSAGACGQDASPKTRVSTDPLTTEQIAIYRAVLKNYMGKSEGPLNIAAKTSTQEPSGPFFDKDCVHGISLQIAENLGSTIHRLSQAVLLNPQMILVDPDEQQAKINANDPANLLKRVIDDHEEVSQEQLDNSLTLAFSTGLFTFSEIVFDKAHRHAVTSYSFVCGELCGGGSAVVLKKRGNQWKVSKVCGQWIS